MNLEWVSQVSTGISALAAVASSILALMLWFISKQLYNLQKSIEDDKKPLVHIWCNGSYVLTPKDMSSFTFINLGKEPLPIRRLRILGSAKQALDIFIKSPDAIDNKDNDHEVTLKAKSEIIDLILTPNKIYNISFKTCGSPMIVEVMYYDNSFETKEIDTSILGGKYILTGKGKK